MDKKLSEKLKDLYGVEWQATDDRPANYEMFLAGIGASGGTGATSEGYRAGDVLVVEAKFSDARKPYYFVDVRGEGRMQTGADLESVLSNVIKASPGAAASLTSGLV